MSADHPAAEVTPEVRAGDVAEVEGRIAVYIPTRWEWLNGDWTAIPLSVGPVLGNVHDLRRLDAVRALADERLAVHGPHVECNNAGCRRRGLSGMHCADPCEEPHEDCADFAAWTKVRAALGDADADGFCCPTLRDVGTCSCPGREQEVGR